MKQIKNILLIICLFGLVIGYFKSALLFFACLLILIFLYQKNNQETKEISSTNNKYQLKTLLSKNELTFYHKLLDLNEKYIVVPQVNLAAILDKVTPGYNNELFKNIDFGIFTKEFELLLLIELNDSSHNNYQRKQRDIKVRELLKNCHIKLITFYTSYPNDKNYVITRIMNAINSNDNTKTLDN